MDAAVQTAHSRFRCCPGGVPSALTHKWSAAEERVSKAAATKLKAITSSREAAVQFPGTPRELCYHRHGQPTPDMPALLTPEQQSTLAERVRARDPSAEEELVRLFSGRIALMARLRTRDAETARDVTQEVLLAVFRALRTGQLREAERLTAFVYGIARNLINNYLRTRARLPPEDALDGALAAASLPDQLEDSERGALVRRALVVLDSTDRRILLLTLIEGLKPAEIGARLGMSSEAVRTRKSRALKKTAEQVKTLSRT